MTEDEISQKMALGEEFARAKDFDKAISEFQSILRERPDHSDASEALTWAFFLKDDFDSAINAAENVLAARKSINICLMAARFFADAEKFEECFAWYKRALDQGSGADIVSVAIEAADVAWKTQTEDLEPFIKRGLLEEPTNPSLIYRGGVVAFEKRETAWLEEMSQKLTQLNPDSWQRLDLEARLAELTKDYRSAERLYSKLLENKPDHFFADIHLQIVRQFNSN